MASAAPEITEAVDVRLLANLSENFRSPYEAVFELVDNGLASRLPGRPVAVTITGSGGVGGTLNVITKGGFGMGVPELQAFLRWGKEAEEAGLNRFGQGGKAAIGYLGRGVRIRCNRHDEADAYQIEDHDWLARPGGRLKSFIPQVVSPALHGEGVVQIEIINVRKAVNLKRLARELAWRYRPALANGWLKLTIGRTRILPDPLPADTQAEFRRELTFATRDGSTERAIVSGWVGIAPPRFEGRGGVRCGAFGRVVHQNDYFGHKTSSFKASLNSLVGEVDLSFVPVVLNKNAFDTGSPAWAAVVPVMQAALEPFVRQLLKRKETNEPSDEERLRAMEARDLAHEALEQIAAESNRRGLGGASGGRKRPEPRPPAEERLVRPAHERRPPQPQTPPPPDPVGTLLRKGSTLDWDVRTLDQKIRSATALENGRTEIVINNQYPVYKQRAGDLLYMLETGLREELKSSVVEEATVAEYEEQVTEAIYIAAIGLSGR